jgi:superfamily I DNA/RNA helicase
MDEFQDTTRMQYRVVQTVFRESPTVLTAVGDNKQRIMVWAGALKNVFADFQQNFSAKMVPLIHNYRAAPRLIQILNVLSKSIDLRATDQAHPQGNAIMEEGGCRCTVFVDHHEEAESVADEIARLVREGVALPSDICILTRQLPADYTTHVSKRLAEKGIKSRVENERQDRMAEPVVQFLLQILVLASKGKCVEAWDTVREFISRVWDVHDPESDRRIDDVLTALLSDLRPWLQFVLPTDKNAVIALMNQIIGVADRSEVAMAFPQYAQGDYLDQLVGFVVDEIITAGGRNHSWDAVIADVLGLDSVPIMTIHKSKGLEYHSVFFIGLEDQAFWGYRNDPDEEACAFFVAFSRAKKQVFFTSCEFRIRANSREGPTRANIESFYQALEEAGVTVEYPP